MTTAKLNTTKTAFHFNVNAEILEKACVYSTPEMEIRNVKWIVKLCRKAADGDVNAQLLGVYLIPVVENHSMDWACDAEASFKLFHNDGLASHSIKKHLLRKTFDKRNSSHGIDNFIDWDGFTQNHVFANQAKFEIEISVDVLRRMSMESRDINQVSAEFHVVIEGVSKMEHCYSSDAILQGVRWSILCEKNSEHLGVYLNIDENDIDSDWSYKVDATFKLASCKRDVEAITESWSHEFSEGNWGYPTFLKWTDFVDEDKKFVSNDKANLFVKIKVEQPKPRWNIGDLTPTKSAALLECCLCLDSFSSGNICSTKCGHLFCKPCFDKAIERSNACSFCNRATSSADLHPIFF